MNRQHVKRCFESCMATTFPLVIGRFKHWRFFAKFTNFALSASMYMKQADHCQGFRCRGLNDLIDFQPSLEAGVKWLANYFSF